MIIVVCACRLGKEYRVRVFARARVCVCVCVCVRVCVCVCDACVWLSECATRVLALAFSSTTSFSLKLSLTPGAVNLGVVWEAPFHET